MSLGGKLKRKERISGCYADALSNLYLCSCVLKHYENQGCIKEDLPLLHWACRESLYRVEQAMAEILEKLPIKPATLMLHGLIFPLGKTRKLSHEKLIPQLAAAISTNTPIRDRLTQGIYINDNPTDPTGRIEASFRAVLAAETAEAKLKQALKRGQLVKGDLTELVKQALTQKLISQDEAKLLAKADEARLQAIVVDDFNPNDL